MTTTTINQTVRTEELELFPFPVAEGLNAPLVDITGDAEASDTDLMLSVEDLADIEDLIVSKAIATAQAYDLDDMVGMYLREIGVMPLLSHEDEIELAKQMEAGRDARTQLLAAMEGDEEMDPARK
ncbi:MAG: sigma-70 factor domain-containing protein [Anaerolineaceae bacterium]